MILRDFVISKILVFLILLVGGNSGIKGHEPIREFKLLPNSTNYGRHNMYSESYELVPLDKKSIPHTLTKREIRMFIEYGSIEGPCRSFIEGDVKMQTFTTPTIEDDDKYPRSKDCVRVIEAPRNHIIQLDFRKYFEIEPSAECKFDYLEVRDGGHGYADLIGYFCGSAFPDMITSSGRFLWLHFHSDESIEMRGFHAVYNFTTRPSNIPPEVEMCEINVSGHDGILNITDIPDERLQITKNHSVPLECMWIITVKEGLKIQLTFTKYKLVRPNECDKNYIDVFNNKTDLPRRVKHLCGSIPDSVQSTGHIMFIRFYAQPVAINSTFEALFTATRDRGDSKGNCDSDEYDCQDNFCIDKSLVCNKNPNCRYKWDEMDCEKKKKDVAEHIIIIICVFCLIVSGMCAAFLFNCIRKLMRDHRLIQEHLRASRENRLDEIKPRKKKSSSSKDDLKKSTISLIVPPPTITQMPLPPVLSPIPDGGRTSPTNSIHSSTSQGFALPNPVSYRPPNRHQQDLIPILKDNSSGTLDSCDELEPTPEMCDMACQTRESLFQVPSSRNILSQYSYGWKPGQEHSPSSSTHTDLSCPHQAPYRAEVAIDIKDKSSSSPTPPLCPQKHHRQQQRPYSVQTTKSAPDVIVTH